MEYSLLETIVYGRIKPHIYAFRTVKVPKYTKVGDTYRPLEVRLNEWKKIIKEDLENILYEPAFADSSEEVYFRDYAVHFYLEEFLKRHRLRKTDPEGNPWFSNEFFLDTNREHIEKAINDIKESYASGNPRVEYEFYKTLDKSHKEKIVRKNLVYPLRDNQRQVVENFIIRYNSPEPKLNLLMYAVMRFGKSFTALKCALAMDAKLVIILSAKAEVWDSWNRTLYEHKDFNGYTFIKTKNLSELDLASELKQGRRYVLFLSLQDLQGKDIKERHKQLFVLDEPKTLLIVDETHFGARASEYGQVLRETPEGGIIVTNDGGAISSDKLNIIKNFENVRVRLHLSGTPYRILMSGEFADKDIISFIQYSDIVKAQKEWDRVHFSQDDDNRKEEWDNPYYGFPEMIRFAFNPNKESMDLINEMKKKGVGGLSELFAPVSINKSDSPRFKHEDKILGLLKAIDGTKEDDNIFPFLAYDRIQKGEMCHHMVWVLPFQSSCDAMELLLKTKMPKESQLHSYDSKIDKGFEILNISGFNCPRKYNNPKSVRRAIEDFEKSGIKTITLTVQRMLTGSTVPQWDTMLFFKDTSSPQEYDQATFRIQNPFIKTINGISKKGEKKVIKLNMKPQTLLVDFDPSRLFRMQEIKSEFYIGDSGKGNKKLKERIQEDLEISPVIYVDAKQLVRVEANSIIKAIREYSKTRSVLDEAELIPSDISLIYDDKIKKIIESFDVIDYKKGLELNPFNGENTALEGLDELINTTKKKSKEDNNKNEKIESEEEKLKKRLKTLYAQILMFAFLSNSDIRYLEDIILLLENKNADDIRIANNLGLNLNILKIIANKASNNTRLQLDHRIEGIHELMQNIESDPIEKAQIALTKFNRLSVAEIVTPQDIRDVLIDGIPKNKITNDSVFLDLASKQGELTITLLNKYPNLNKKKIYSVATSSIAYEMTRKVYHSLDIPVENVILPPKASKDYFNDIFNLVNDHIKSTPNIILCCPPFQKPKGGGRGDGGSDIYPSYYELCKKFNPNPTGINTIPFIFCMYIKATWNTHSTQFQENIKETNKERKETNKNDIKISNFRKTILTDEHIFSFYDYLNAKPFYNQFQSVTLRGGVNILFWDAQISKEVNTHLFIDKNNIILKEKRLLLPLDLKKLMDENNIVDQINKDYPYIRIGGHGYNILKKVLNKAKSSNLSFIKVKPRNVFKIKDKIEKKYLGTAIPECNIKVYVQEGNWVFVDPSIVGGLQQCKDLINSWKVVAAKGSSGEDTYPHAIISQPRIVEPGSVCSDTYLVIKEFDSKEMAEDFVKYMKTSFFRFMILLAKNDQNLTRHCYRFVPDIPANQYPNIYKYFELNQDEQIFIKSFVKEWKSEDKEGVCLNRL